MEDPSTPTKPDPYPSPPSLKQEEDEEDQRDSPTAEQKSQPTTAMSTGNMATPPLPYSHLSQIASSACASALSSATRYDHSCVAEWNAAIISAILRDIIAAAPANTYKLAVNSTIIQHQMLPGGSTSSSRSVAKAEGGGDGDEDKEKMVVLNGLGSGGGGGGGAGGADHPRWARRGMHSATAGYWNLERDGVWSYKYEGGEDRGMDVVVSLLWVAIA